MVPTPPLGMAASGRNHLHTSSRGYRKRFQGRFAAWRNWRHHRRCTIAVSPTPKSQSHVCLESLSEKLKKDITNERGYRGNFKIGGSKHISDGPSYPPFLPHSRAFKFSHQKIRIEQEDDKTYLDHSSPSIFLHRQYQLRSRFD
jgi:hypothetical protein